MTHDLESLRGAWRFLSIEIGGRRIDPTSFAGARIEVDGDRFTTFSAAATYSGRLALRGGNSVREIDIEFLDGPHAGSKSLGLYRLTGDHWELSIGLAGQPRPGDFTSPRGSSHAWQVLQRARVV